MSGSSTVRIVFLNHWAHNLGGAELSLLDILSCVSMRADTHLVTSEAGELVDRAQLLGVRTHVVVCGADLSSLRRNRLFLSALRSLGGLLSFALYAGRLSLIVKRLSPALVHANVPKSHIAACALRLAGYRGAYCFHVREIFAAGSAAEVLYRVLLPARRCTIIAISRAVRDALPRRVQPLATVIYNGVSVPATGSPSPTDRIRFLSLGRVVPWKGCHLLVEALSAVVKTPGAPEVSLSIVGDTMYWPRSYRDELEAAIRVRGLHDVCSLLPHTRDPASVFAGHHVFCCASLDEPFGRSVAEAQAFGLPVVAFSCGGVPEIVQHGTTGLLVPYGDVAALAASMAHLARSPALIREMGSAGRRRAAELFNVTIQAPRLADFLLSITREP